MSLTVASFALASCEKNATDQAPTLEQGSTSPLDPARIYRKPTTTTEIKLVENLGKVTAVLQELYQDRANVNVVNAAINARAYSDESVLLGDLLYPKKSRVAQTPYFQAYAKSMNLSLPEFALRFWAVVNRRHDAEFTRFLTGILTGRSNAVARGTATTAEMGEPVSIYFPYSRQFMSPLPAAGSGGGGNVHYDAATSLVTATADADVGWGYQPQVSAAGEHSYRKVMVDDDFAYRNPVHIVGLNGIVPYEEPQPGPAGERSAAAGASRSNRVTFEPTPPIPLPGATRPIRQVYVGDVRCTHNYDALASFTGNGGGPEIRFTRADGFLKFADGQVQADMFVSGDQTITRWHVRNRRFFAYNSEWDGDWESANLNQNLAIFEEDNRNQLKISGSLATTVKDKAGNQVVGTIGFERVFRSDDALIRQQNLNQASFFLLNRVDREGESFSNWPVRDRSSNVSFTLKDRTYIP